MTLKEIKTTTKPTESETLITVENVSKKFCRDLKKSLFYGVKDICTDLTGGRRKSDTLRSGEFWALDNITFDLKQGEALGLVGANGAGKSTLLRILSGLIKPDTGSVRVRGRLAPLIALGAGFNPILTGRENIYANMAILGLPTQQIEEKFEDVVEFAEIAEAIDAPVQTYSSGMAARLGFACAIHVEPEILLIDEVLAVGDVRFKLKCHQRLAQLKEKGTAFILVSHTPYIVLNACEKAIYLNRGKLAGAGETEKIIQQYEQDLRLSGEGTATGLTILPQKSEAESLGLDMLALFFRNQDQEIIEAPQTGEPAYLCIKCKAQEAIADIDLRFKINYLSGENKQVLDIMSVNDNTTLNAPQGIFEVQMYMPYCTFIEGVYTAKVYVKKGMLSFDLVPSFRFRVDCKVNISRCAFYQPRSWHILADEKGRSWQEIERHTERFVLQKGEL